MALTPLDYLARRHRAEQSREAAAAARFVRRSFADVDLSDRNAVAATISTTMPTLLQRRASALARSRRYYGEARQLALGNGSFPDPTDPADDSFEQGLRESLYVLTRGRLRQREDAYGSARARSMNIDDAAGAAVRHVLDGGRVETIRLVKADERAIGFVRVTAEDKDVCYFCTMLASREDYKGSSFSKSDPRFIFGGNPLANAKVHDRCRCSIRPVFANEDTPAQTQRAKALWYDLSEGDGQEALRSFRRNYERLLREQEAPVWQAA